VRRPLFKLPTALLEYLEELNLLQGAAAPLALLGCYAYDYEIQYSSTALLLLVNPCILHRNNHPAHPNYVFIVWKEDASLPAMFNPLCSSTNQELFKKSFCNQSSHYGNYGWFPLQMKAILFLPQNQHFVVSKDNGTQRRSMKNALHVQQHGKRHLLGWSDVEQWKNQPRSLSHCWVTQVLRHQAGRQAVSKLVS